MVKKIEKAKGVLEEARKADLSKEISINVHGSGSRGKEPTTTIEMESKIDMKPKEKK